MLQESFPPHDQTTRPLFAYFPLLMIDSVLAGYTPGRLFVDHSQQPQTAVLWFKDRVIVAGQVVVEPVRQLLSHLYLPEVKQNKFREFSLYATPEWADHVPLIMPLPPTGTANRVYYRLTNADACRWKTEVPADFTLRRVDQELLADNTIMNLSYVTDEMVSERPSVADFLAYSFGHCLVHHNKIVAWCMSEYNTGSRCELGIETAADFRRRGLATLTATAVIHEAVQRGITDIGWLSWANNLPSIKTAQKLGLRKIATFQIYYLILGES